MSTNRLPTRRIVTFLGLALLCLLVPLAHVVGRPAMAQDSLPTPEGQLGGPPSLATEPPLPPTSLPPTAESGDADIPSPEDCTVEARSIESLLALAATPAAGDVAARTGAPPFAAGRPASPAEIAGVTATIREAIACDNAGETLRVWALYSDDFIRSGDAEIFVIVDQLGGPVILKGIADVSRTRSETMPDVVAARRLPDGRIVALVLARPNGVLLALGSSASVLDVAFVPSDGRWLVDDTRIVRET